MLLLLWLLPIAAYASIFASPPESRIRAEDVTIASCETLFAQGFDREPVDAQNGLVTAHVPLTVDNAIEAYRRGIFAWGMVEKSGELAEWFSPPFRGILDLNNIRISARDLQFIRNRMNSGEYRVTFDRNFAGVIHNCANQERWKYNERTGRMRRRPTGFPDASSKSTLKCISSVMPTALRCGRRANWWPDFTEFLSTVCFPARACFM